jgi:hypothetical protein
MRKPRDPTALDEFVCRAAPHVTTWSVVLALGGGGGAEVVRAISADEHRPVHAIKLETSGGARSYDTTRVVPVSFAQGTLTGSSIPPS